MVKGTILMGIGGFYYVQTDAGLFECRARGIFRKDKITPLVGDHVQIEILDADNKKGSLDVIEKRTTELVRPRVSNIDQAIIVFAAKDPALNPDLLDRFLVLAEEQGLAALICINKIDLVSDGTIEELLRIYQKIGYRTLKVSAEKKIGIEALQEALCGKISVFAGPSGVGKSSLINSLSPGLTLKTGAVSDKIKRGKHTTRHAELMELFPDSFIVDSPGFTSLSLSHIRKDELKQYFIEFQPFEGNCHYTGCSHTHEPDCAVKKEVGGQINERRYERYVNLYQELQQERNY